MKCPHCLVEVHESFSSYNVYAFQERFQAKNAQGTLCQWQTSSMVCPACKKGIIRLIEQNIQGAELSELQVLPFGTSRNPVPAEVPPNLAEDYIEAAQVLVFSPKASAALSRRCLQGILRDNGFTEKDLAPAIKAVVTSGKLPVTLAASLDAVRNIGNFAAHPTKDTNTGMVLPVEAHEAEWNLDVLDGLFDYFYVLPAKEKAKINELNKKLASAGKPLVQ
ncbi:DUF4145 domain-containing protein [Janthinobacterium sp. 1_2014MBL_MicDiv]|uniref:DUF4145 domain-containing protein n=1 Tax=Janthinobacterium sp. 1_2014MBL_MicDiv TaxID=1644131 RepID=UPI001E3B9475|nr:DUF4145 domain-containing protein [Janthinobacterium sp. 1_2014MBL_MicDiv]